MRNAYQFCTAYSAYRFAILLRRLGRQREQLEALQEAVHIMHQLPRILNGTDSAADRLASACLHNLASCLDDFGRVEEAVEVSWEAIKLHRKLAAADASAESLDDLSWTLNNHSNYLFDSGHKHESLEIMEEAILIRRELIEKHPTQLAYNLAALFANHSMHLRHMGRMEEAIDLIRSAVDINRGLAASQPVEFEPGLASTLTSLSTCLADLGHKEKAVDVAHEAIPLCRRLAIDHPSAIDYRCAGWLNNLSNVLSTFDHEAQALVIIKEAVEIYRRHAAGCPEAFLPHLATSLYNMSLVLDEVGHEDEALAKMQETVSVLRSIIIDRPSVAEHLQDLAKSLTFISRRVCKAGHHAEALEKIQEAVNIWRVLPARIRDSYRKSYISSLTVLHDCLENLGRKEESVAVAMETIVLFHDFGSSEVAPAIALNMEQADTDVIQKPTTLAELLQKLQHIYMQRGSDSLVEDVKAIRQFAEQNGDLHTVTELPQATQKYFSIMRQIGWSDASTATWSRSMPMEHFVELGNQTQERQAITPSDAYFAQPIRTIHLTAQLAQDLECS